MEQLPLHYLITHTLHTRIQIYPRKLDCQMFRQPIDNLKISRHEAAVALKTGHAHRPRILITYLLPSGTGRFDCRSTPRYTELAVIVPETAYNVGSRSRVSESIIIMGALELVPKWISQYGGRGNI